MSYRNKEENEKREKLDVIESAGRYFLTWIRDSRTLSAEDKKLTEKEWQKACNNILNQIVGDYRKPTPCPANKKRAKKLRASRRSRSGKDLSRIS